MLLRSLKAGVSGLVPTGRFFKVLDEKRIDQAVASLTAMLGVTDLKGKHFLDAGSGSGLFSLAARRLGAEVHSFDYDPQSVACTQDLRRLCFPDDSEWVVEEASVLDAISGEARSVRRGV